MQRVSEGLKVSYMRPLYRRGRNWLADHFQYAAVTSDDGTPPNTKLCNSLRTATSQPLQG